MSDLKQHLQGRMRDGGLWGVFLLSYLLFVGVYQIILRPLWVEGFGAAEVPICGQMTLTIPGEVPRAFRGDSILPNRAALIQGELAFQIEAAPGGQTLSTTGGKTYYIWVPPNYHQRTISFNITAPQCHQQISINVEGRSAYLFKRFLALFLGLPFATLLALLGVGWKVYEREWKQRKEEVAYLERLQQFIEQFSAPEQALRYYQIWQQDPFTLKNRGALKHWWHNYAVRFSNTEQLAIAKALLAKHWLPCLITNTTKSAPCPSKCQKVLDALKESGLLPDNLRNQINNACISPLSPKDFAPLIQVLGLHPDLIDFLSTYYQIHWDDFPEALKQWRAKFQHIGFALGKAVYDKIPRESLEKTPPPLNNPPTPRPLPPRLALWPSCSPPNSCAVWNLSQFQGPADIPSPFGPIKAEDDPRLPLKLNDNDPSPAINLFWEGAPLWQTLQTPEPAWFQTRPGCGTTTLIWMARHRYRYWGAHGPALALYIPFGKATQIEETCRRAAQQALAKAILANLAEDPTWFLGIPHPDWQQDILSLLYHHYGTAERILGQIALPKRPENDTTFLALKEGILSFSPARGTSYPWQAKPWETLQEILLTARSSMAHFGSRARRQPNVPVIVLVEALSFSKAGSVEELVSQCEFWRWGTVKIFSPAQPPPSLSITVQPCEWTADDLIALLTHRLQQAASQFGEIGEEALATTFQNILNLPHKAAPWETLAAYIFEQAGKPKSPKALVQWGNRQARALRLCRTRCRTR